MATFTDPKAPVTVAMEAEALRRVQANIDKKADAATTYTKDEVDSKLSRVYNAGGSVAFAELPAADAAHLGYVYDVTDDFVTTDAFKEGAGKAYPAGTNVGIVAIPAENEGEDPTYAYDAFAGFIDVSGFVEKETGKGLSSNDFTDELKTKLEGIGTADPDEWAAALDEILGPAEASST